MGQEYRKIPEDTIFEISDPVDDFIFFTGTKEECAIWLFERNYRQKGEFNLETVCEVESRVGDYKANTEPGEDEMFELPDHLKLQMIGWKIGKYVPEILHIRFKN